LQLISDPGTQAMRTTKLLSASCFAILALISAGSVVAQGLQPAAYGSDASCCAAAIDDCGCDDCCGGGWSWFAGYENVIVKPIFSGNTAVFDENGADPTVHSSFDWEMEYSPRFFFGFQNGCGTAITARYWTFDHTTAFSRTEVGGEDLAVRPGSFTSPSLGVDGTVNASHSLKMDVIDLEASQRVDLGCLIITAGGGIRYADMEQSGFWSETGGSEEMILNHDFRGAGPTVMMEFSKPVGCWDVFVLTRGSMLMGERNWRLQDEDLNNPDERYSYDTIVGVGEMQLGVERNYCLSSGSIFSLRAALESQLWFNGGSISAGEASTAARGTGPRADQLHMGFFGFNLTTAFEY